MARDGEAGRREAHPQEHLPRHQRGDQGPQVGGEVHELHVAGGGTHVQLAQGTEGQQQEGPGAGAVEAVVDPHQQGEAPDDEPALAGGHIPRLLRQALFPQQHGGGQGQHQQQNVFQDPLVHHELEAGAQIRAANGQRRGNQGQGPVHAAVFQIAEGGKGGAHAGGELVGAQGEVGRKTGQQVHRHGDDAAAPADAVHEARGEDPQADEQHQPDGIAVDHGSSPPHRAAG